jgi:hypothetical protein
MGFEEFVDKAIAISSKERVFKSYAEARSASVEER